MQASYVIMRYDSYDDSARACGWSDQNGRLLAGQIRTIPYLRNEMYISCRKYPLKSDPSKSSRE